ncbi:Bug family tripartite tricarboxylate transporter substrate binding protein [Humitalea sp. 24SJ18S-53]|uniref:Bug family tripartite tricarboxylate transporter substrate binding protein n=1 Tax=Humitalea sp. 24SJ18S-53 TaxID=3422307 RepID=UPI003D671689
MFQRRAVLAAPLILIAGQACAAWPDRPLRLIVPVAPAGPTDIAARIIAAPLGPALGQNVVVENRPGGGGNIGTAAVANGPADGYTILMGSFSNAANPAMFNDLPFDTQRDLTAVAQVTRVPLILTVNPGLPVQTLQELIALAKQRPLTYGTGGVGTSSHLAGEMFIRFAGIPVPAAHYRGAAPANADLVAGQIAFMFDNPQTALPLIAAGRVRPIAVTTGERIPELPQVPTARESGLRDLVVTSWHGLFMRTGTPPEIIARINREVNAALQTPDLQERFKALGVQPGSGSPEDFAAFFNSEIERWGQVIREAGIKPE